MEFFKKKKPVPEPVPEPPVEMTDQEVGLIKAILQDYAVSIQRLNTKNGIYVKDSIAVILNKLNKLQEIENER